MRICVLFFSRTCRSFQCSVLPPRNASPPTARRRRSTFSRSSISTQVYFKYSPTAGTSAGLHQYDTQLEDYSAATLEKQRAALHEWEKKIAAIDPAALDAPQAADREILLNSIRSAVAEAGSGAAAGEESRQVFERRDGRDFRADGAAVRAGEHAAARSGGARKADSAGSCEEARKNLKNPPHIYTEIALEQIDGTVSFFQNDVPSAFADATDATAKAEFAKRNAAVIEALQELWRVDEERTCCRARTATTAGCGHVPQGARVSTRWSTFRSTACCRLAMTICTRTRRSLRAWRRRLTRPRRRSRSWRSWRRCILRRTSCCRRFTTRSTR